MVYAFYESVHHIFWSKHVHGVQRRVISVDNCFVFFEIIIFCFVVAI